MLMSLPFHAEQMKKASPALRLRKQVAKFIGYLYYNVNQECGKMKGSLQNHDYLNAFGACCSSCQLMGYKEANRLMGFAFKAGALEHDDSIKVLKELKTQVVMVLACFIEL